LACNPARALRPDPNGARLPRQLPAAGTREGPGRQRGQACV
jgi:hypothetical protein